MMKFLQFHLHENLNATIKCREALFNVYNSFQQDRSIYAMQNMSQSPVSLSISHVSNTSVVAEKNTRATESA